VLYCSQSLEVIERRGSRREIMHFLLKVESIRFVVFLSLTLRKIERDADLRLRVKPRGSTLVLKQSQEAL